MKSQRREGDRKGGAQRRLQRVIADAWRGLVSKPGSREVTGGEEIVDKAWIDASGDLVHHGCWRTHQEVALEHLRLRRGFQTSGDLNKDRLRAESVLLGEGWIRVQCYAGGGLGLQGGAAAIRARGYRALELVPKPRRVYVMVWPDNAVSLYAGKALTRLLEALKP
jgi:hypothetical protein